MFTRVCVLVWSPEVDATCLLQLLPTSDTEAGSLTEPVRLVSAGLARQLAPGSPCLPVPRTEVTGGVPASTQLLHDFWGPEPWSSRCVTGTLLTETSPGPCTFPQQP